MKEPNHLEIIDTSDKLTLEEIKELKSLAQLSKIAKWVMALIIGLISLFGMDKISSIFDHK